MFDCNIVYMSVSPTRQLVFKCCSLKKKNHVFLKIEQKEKTSGMKKGALKTKDFVEV